MGFNVPKNLTGLYSSRDAPRRKVSLINEIYKLMVSMYPQEDIRNIIMSDKYYSALVNSKEEYELFYNIALSRLSDNTNMSKNSLIRQAIYRYEKEIKKLLDDTNPETKWMSKLLAMDVMKDLEYLLGFNNKRIKIRIMETIESRKQNVADLNKVNLNVLPISERIDFLKIIEKAKISEEEMFIKKDDSSYSSYELVN